MDIEQILMRIRVFWFTLMLDAHIVLIMIFVVSVILDFNLRYEGFRIRFTFWTETLPFFYTSNKIMKETGF